MIAGVLMLCLQSSALALSPETKKEIIEVYNFTADMYGKVVGLFDDLENKLIDAGRAEDKVDEWLKQYKEQTSSAPSEARSMREKMTEMLKSAGEVADDYEPLNRRTKDALADLEEAKAELRKVMTDVKYLVE
jgi:chromosome segregation ATPase